jgi:hypothetical protein
MKKAMPFTVAFVFAAMIALCWLPQPALAQRGGHGGGGGFHGGGGGGFHGGGGGGGFHGGGFHGGGGGGYHGGGSPGYGGGRYYGGYHGGYHGGRGGYYGGRGGYYGGHGGYHGGHGGYHGGHGGYGWGGRYWGRYGHGWGWGWGYGWPYWGWGWGYPYGYYNPWYYSPYYYYPYYYGSDYPPDYPDPDNGNDDPPPADPNARPQPKQYGPPRSWQPPVPGGALNANYANSNVAPVAERGPVLSVDRISVTPSSYRARSIPERSTTEQAILQANAPLRPEMRRALQRLREMPPFVREREIETGRYRDFSPREKELLRSVT